MTRPFRWDLLGKRAVTMRWALERHEDSPTIVETGCLRGSDSWLGDGMSTVVFDEWVARHGGHLYSVDIDADNVAHARRLVSRDRVTVIERDSLEYLGEATHPIDLLYLDSFDYPDGQLRDLYGGREDIHAAMATLEEMGDAEIVSRHGDIILPCQRHVAREAQMALPLLRPGSTVVIDDANLPGGGKAGLAREVLEDAGWTCAMDGYQAVYVS